MAVKGDFYSITKIQELLFYFLLLLEVLTISLLFSKWLTQITLQGYFISMANFIDPIWE